MRFKNMISDKRQAQAATSLTYVYCGWPNYNSTGVLYHHHGYLFTWEADSIFLSI